MTMRKLILLLVAFVCAVSAIGNDFVGRTYSGSRSEGGVKATATIKFQSDTKASFSGTVTGQKPTRLSVYYEVDGDCINLYRSNTYSYDTSLYIDSDHEYGDDCLIMPDEYGNVMIVLKRVAAGGASGKSRAKSKKKR